MSILTESEIRKELELWNIIVHDGVKRVTNPVTLKDQSIDVRLGQFLYIENSKSWFKGWINLLEEDYIAREWDFILAHTEEFIWTNARSYLVSQFFLKSTAWRLWIIHTHSWWGEIWFHNRWAMEFIVWKEITLRHKQAIWQIIFQRVEGETNNDDYSKKGNYQKTNNLDELVKNWNRDMILPWTKELKIINTI